VPEASGARIAVLIGVGREDGPTTRDVENLLRRFDSLLTEAKLLRERVTTALRQYSNPFWPERRRQHGSHTPERRRG
jgi:hypothetical protein